LGFLTKLAAWAIGVPLLIILVVVLAFLLIWLTRRLRDAYYRRQFGAKWAPQGKFVLFVYSNSPNWQAYVEEQLLPRIEPHAVVLNWSERQRLMTEAPLEFRAFRFWAGDREFNPIAIAVPAHGRVQIVRFWQAFRDLKHGKPLTLRTAEQRLATIVAELEAEYADS
jgi:hypothetical protein